MPSPRDAGYPTILFGTQADFRAWLKENHASAQGVWLRLARKASRLTSLSYAEALDVALCYGWIDGQKRTHDAESWLQKFTPRGKRSLWSNVNRGHVERLIRSRAMRAPGLAAVAAAKADGRWDRAYDSPGRSSVPEDFQVALDAHPTAKAFYAQMKRHNQFAMLFRIQTAKTPARRAERIRDFVAMLARGESVHP